MALLGIPEKCVVKGRFGDNTEFRMIFYAAKSDDAVTDAVMWTGYLNNVFQGGALGLWRNTMTLYEYEVYRWDGNEWQTSTTQAYSKVGTNPSDELLPHQSASVLVGKSAKKRTFGRKFWPGPLESQQSDGTLAGATITALAGVAAAWLQGYTSGAVTLTPGIWTKALDIIGFTSAIVDSIIGSQRRRKPNVGI